MRAQLGRRRSRMVTIGFGLAVAATIGTVLAAGTVAGRAGGLPDGASTGPDGRSPVLLALPPPGGVIGADDVALVDGLADVAVVAPIDVVGYVDLPQDPGQAAARPAGGWDAAAPAVHGRRWVLGDAPAPAATSRYLLVAVDPGAQDALGTVVGPAAPVAGRGLSSIPADPVGGLVPVLVVPTDGEAVAAGLVAAAAEGRTALVRQFVDPATALVHRAAPGTDGPRTAARSLSAVGVLDGTAAGVLLDGLAGHAGLPDERVGGPLAGAAGLLVASRDDVRVLLDPAAYPAQAPPETPGGAAVASPVPPDGVATALRLGMEAAPTAAVGAERARAAAESILRRTDLQVWAGGSQVLLAPALDTQSTVLVALLMAACGVFVGNATAAELRARRGEIATLGVLGWRRHQVVAGVLAEVASVAVGAGVLAAAGAHALAPRAGLTLTWPQAALAVPGTVVLGVVAALGPAWAVASAPIVVGPWRRVWVGRPGRAARSWLAFAVRDVMRAPARMRIAVLTVGVGVGTLTAVLGIEQVYGGSVVGSVLGGPVSLTARTLDLVAAASLTVLGAVVVADMTVASVRERRHELATMRALGWSRRSLGWLVLVESTLTATAGAVAGAWCAAAVVAGLAGALEGSLVVVAAAAAAAAVAVSTLAASGAVLTVRRMPTTTLLGEDA